MPNTEQRTTGIQFTFHIDELQAILPRLDLWANFAQANA